MSDQHEDRSDSIAIIGMAGRFPGAASVDELWTMLCEGREAISFFDADQLDPEVDAEQAAHPQYVPARGVMDGADCFDAHFFGIAPSEAQVIDPQGRALLELAWGALENAGYNPLRQRDPVGVFVGSGFNSYFVDNVLSRPDIVRNYGRHLVELANAPDYLATRISYKLDLKGPSLSLYTGCSSSLVAICYAVDSLLNYQADMALAGGAFVAMPLKSGYVYHEGEMSSPDGHTRPFDADAAGTVFSSGAGMVLLKRLDEAIADGDYVYAVIRGTGLNNDGSDKVSFTAPSVDGQAQAIALAHAVAGVTPDMISYVETHGTGTPLGDPVEIEALTKSFEKRQRDHQYCAIGSIKSNVGHLDAAAGVAGLIKVALSLHHRTLPPSLNFRTPNPAIPFEKTPFFVNTKLTKWISDSGRLVAGVSSFGVGGTNAHVVLEEAPPNAPLAPVDDRWTALQLAARTPAALDRLTEQLANFFDANPTVSLQDTAATLRYGREHFAHRRVIVCNSPADAAQALVNRPVQRLVTSKSSARDRQTIFMFTGQGSQYAGMGRELYTGHKVFRDEVDTCAETLLPLLDVDLRDLMFTADANISDHGDRLNETWLTQPALFTIEYALARVWQSMGVTPDACIGHSIGEYVAACIAGVFSLEDALRLVSIRGRLMFGCEPGAMLVVMRPTADIAPLLSSEVSIAAENAPGACVVSGPGYAIEELASNLSAQSIDTRPLRTSHAFHSAMMEPIVDEFVRSVANVARQAPSVPFVSNLTGDWIDHEQATDPQYWADHLRNAVLFSRCVTTLMAEGPSTFIEVGPGSTLTSLARAHITNPEEHLVLPTLRGPKDEGHDEAFLLRAAGTVWANGQHIEWPSADSGFYRKIPLPTYPFEQTRHWIARAQPAQPPSASSQAVAHNSAVSMDAPDRSEEPTKSRTTLDTVLDTWKATLGYDSIGPEDDFFEIGGNSLMAANVVAQVKRTYAIELGPVEIYTTRTARSFAALINERLGASTSSSGNQARSGLSAEDAKKLIG